MARQLTQEIVEKWLEFVSGTFQMKDIWAEIGIEETENREHLRIILWRIEQKGRIAKLSRDGTYRKVDDKLELLDWQSADTSLIVPLKFPFGIEEYCRIYPKSIIILAGSKNEGKTAFLYNFIKLNMADFLIDLFNSETGPEQMKERFEPLDIPEPAPFNAYMRYDNFADVIHPDHISVIDYLDLNSEVYLVGAEIDAIFRKLKSGVAIIGLQKPPPYATFIKGVKKVIERDLAYGGGFTAKRAVLYISLSNHKLKLVYVKTPAKKNVFPDNIQWTYSFNEQGYFINIQRPCRDEIELL